ncbi:MAG: MBL fold metallo-hydrolase [Deltaproteobacteria bacterium]|nr:MAG: MBL fold metallo-hydrolase [Deltaproteobacteria bacterium]
MRRFLVLVAAAVILLALVGYAFRKPITLRMIERIVASNLDTHLLRELPDGLHVALCGAGSPLPDPRRSGPCTAVIAGERLYIVDVGSGASRLLSQMRIPQGEIDAIFLTHFHSDHIDGLGELLLQRWANGSSAAPAPVYGPAGVEAVVEGFRVAYGPDRRYRIAHHGPDVVPPAGAGGVARPFATPADGEAEILIDADGLVVTAFRVAHAPVEPAVGYRFDYKGRSAVLSGDTTRSTNLQAFARDADLLVHEALAPQLVALLTAGAEAVGRNNVAAITRDILDYHATPVEAAEIARDAGVRHLLFYHIVPPLRLRTMEEIFLEGVDGVYDGPVTIGRDGTLVELEAGGDAIEVVELL